MLLICEKDSLSTETASGLHKKGFKKATIRVYKNEKLILLMDGLNHIEEESINPTTIPENEILDKQIFSLSRKWTLRNRADFYREMIIPSLTDTTGYKPKNENLESNWKFNLNIFGQLGWQKKSSSAKDPQKEKIKARLKKDYYSDLMVLAATQTRIQDNYMEVIINLSDKFSKILRDNGYIKKLEYKPKEFWNFKENIELSDNHLCVRQVEFKSREEDY